MQERLQKVLAALGVDSRRHCEALIAAGAVKVNGIVVREPGARADPEKDSLAVFSGGAWRDVARKARKPLTVMMNKPAGTISSMSDPFGGETVADLLHRGGVRERLVPVGRLDKDSEGLLLLSNDGELVNRLTHPRYEHEKTYIVRVAGRWSDEKLSILRSDLVIDGYRIRPCRVYLVRKGENNVHTLKFFLKEGRKRQIRRMCSEAHFVVLSLKRVAIGALRLDESLEPGRWRPLSAAELALLESR